MRGSFFCEEGTLKLYRYRTIKSALRELENGKFYFAEPEELNDPIEGYLKIFWQGDKAAWEGLLKNFVCSLFYNLQTHLLMARNFDGGQRNFLHDSDKVMLINFGQFANSPLNKIFAELGEKFLSEESVQKVADFYGNGNIKSCGKEAEFILRSVIDAACHLCVKKCKSLGLIPKTFEENFFDVAYEISFEDLKHVGDAERRRQIEKIENLNYDATESGLLALKFNRRDVYDSNYEFKQYLLQVKIFFPRIYVEQLKKIMYPNGYVVCFSTTPTNSAMWGNYADNHKGICFIYETENFGGREVINFAHKSLEVKPIKYAEQIIERNFFETLKHLDFLQAEDWLTGAGGIKSCKLAEDDSAGEYDDIYREKFYRKTLDWRHEREYRIFLPDRFYRYGDKYSRQLKYDSAALRGIIFGLRTTLDDKLELIQKLLRLRKSVRDFEFYQAEFDDETQIISVREKFLLIKSLE